MDDGDLRQRISELEAKVDHLYRHLVGIEGGAAVVPPMPSSDETVSAAVRELVAQGNTIAAIKRYRAETGCDLAVANAAIRALRA
jgi:ribosomal protein L7/L12